MSRGKHTEAEMIAAIKQLEAGRRAGVVTAPVTRANEQWALDFV